MCGIVGYTGKKAALPILLDGLKALEYRGYDSAGVVIGTHMSKAVGPVRMLEEIVDKAEQGTTGIAHTRWATHGVPSVANAHPHEDCTGSLWIVHNGIVENYEQLKKELQMRGHTFRSETDSEVFAHLLEEGIASGKTLRQSLEGVLPLIRGTYGLAVMSKKEPDTILIARMGSPLVLGIAPDGYIIASDVAPIIKHTQSVLRLEDGECAEVTPRGYTLFTLREQAITKDPESITWSPEEAEKQGHPHFMLKEMLEMPQAMIQAMRGRIIREEGTVKLGGIESVAERLRNIKRIVIVGCGTAYHAGLVGEYFIESLAGIPVDVEVASEFRYRNAPINAKTAVIAISQSGETADTLAAVREAKRKGSLVLGIVNVVGSAIARETDAGIYNHAGPEMSVASTKAFLSQITILALLAISLGRDRGLSRADAREYLKELEQMPEKIERVLASRETVARIAKETRECKAFAFMGRTEQYPIAKEGALKLKELAYVSAEGYPAGEMKHGPIATVDETLPIIAFAPQGSVYEKMLSNIEEIQARNGKIITIGTEGDDTLPQKGIAWIPVPETKELFTPFLTVVPVQLFAYYSAIERGKNVDRPRNLAKSVTVE